MHHLPYRDCNLSESKLPTDAVLRTTEASTSLSQPSGDSDGHGHKKPIRNRPATLGDLIISPNALTYRLKPAMSYSGLSRAEIYRALAAGKLTARKCGRTLLIDGDSLRALIANLPAATFRVPKAV